MDENTRVVVASNLTCAYFQIPAATELTAFSSDEKQRVLLQDEVWRVYQEFLVRLAPRGESTAPGSSPANV